MGYFSIGTLTSFIEVDYFWNVARTFPNLYNKQTFVRNYIGDIEYFRLSPIVLCLYNFNFYLPSEFWVWVNLFFPISSTIN